MTASMRPIMAGAALGSSAVPPERVWPFSTTRRLVPRRGDLVRESGRGGGGEPEYGHDGGHADGDARAAESPARSLRVRSPTVERRTRSDGGASSLRGSRWWSWLGVSFRAGRQKLASLIVEDLSGAVEDDMAVEHLDPAVHARPRCRGRG